MVEKNDMELQKRKQNRLSGYDYSRPGCYFVTICTKGRKECLGTVVGADVLIGPHVELTVSGTIVQEVLSAMPMVDKFAVMPNHIHVIFRLNEDSGAMRTSPPTQSVPMLVRYFKKEVARRCGETIWQRSYHDHVIRNEVDYLRIWQYIDTNPALWDEDCYYTREN